MEDLDAITANILKKGLARADELEAKAARMRALLADPAFLQARAAAQARAAENALWWEAEESFPLDAPRSLWAGTALDFATGEGTTSHSLVTFARSEGEFRRKLARRIGPNLANAAKLDERARAWAEQRWGGENRPPALSIFFEHHINYS